MALLTAEFGPYVAADYVDDGYADDSSIRVTAALTCDGNIYRFVAVNEAYPAYTWDSTGVWDDWPDNIWGGEGVTLPVRSSSSVTAAVTHAGIATAAVVALQTAVGNHIFAALFQGLGFFCSVFDFTHLHLIQIASSLFAIP